MVQPVFRFAPSPNGYLHLGHAFSALVNHDMARAAGGRLLLRIEDIDAARRRPEFEAAICAILGLPRKANTRLEPKADCSPESIIWSLLGKLVSQAQLWDPLGVANL